MTEGNTLRVAEMLLAYRSEIADAADYAFDGLGFRWPAVELIPVSSERGRLLRDWFRRRLDALGPGQTEPILIETLDVKLMLCGVDLHSSTVPRSYRERIDPARLERIELDRLYSRELLREVIVTAGRRAVSSEKIAIVMRALDWGTPTQVASLPRDQLIIPFQDVYDA
jgi:hypothetical protein